MNKNIRALGVILLLSSAPFYAQKHYEQQWKNIEQQQKKGRVKSSMPAILKLQKQAMNEKNLNQLIKSLKQEFSILKETDEDENNTQNELFFAKIKSLEAHIKPQELPAFRLLKNLFLEEYYQEGYWQIDDRTPLAESDLAKIGAWSRKNFKDYLKQNYQALSEEKDALKTLSVKDYPGVFDALWSVGYYPTFLEYFEHKHIEFLKDGNLFNQKEREINKNTIENSLENLVAKNTGDAKIFYQLRALEQRGESDLALRLKALEALLKETPDLPYKAMVYHALATMQHQNKQDVAAITTIACAKQSLPTSAFLANLDALQEKIEQKQLSLECNRFCEANKNIPIWVAYKNLKAFKLKIYKVNQIESFLPYFANERDYQEKLFKNIKKTLVKTELVSLKDKQDYQEQKSFVALPGLKNGLYVAEYLVDDRSEGHFYFAASDSQVLSINKDAEYRETVQLINRSTGLPMPNEDLVHYQFYRYEPKNIKKSQQKSDASAFIDLENTERGYGQYSLIYLPKYEDFIIRGVARNWQQEEEKTQNITQIFTDRGIYHLNLSLYYYQSSKDASSNFYIEHLPKGQHVFEYEVVANISGVFSSGIAQLQNYYAPQMNSRSQGQSLEIKP